MELFVNIVFSMALIGSDGAYFESQTLMPLTRKVNKSRFVRHQAIKVIEKFAHSEINGHLEKYKLESLQFKEKKWEAYYISKVPKPGGHFLIILDDITGNLQFVPGE